MLKVTVTTRFIGGYLDGIERTDSYIVEVNRWTVGQVVNRPIGGSAYKVIAVHVEPHTGE